MIDGHDERQLDAERLQCRAQINLVEVIKKYLGRSRATVNHDEFSFLERPQHRVEAARLGQI